MGNKKQRQSQVKRNLTATQEVLYAREFKNADRAAGYQTPGIH